MPCLDKIFRCPDYVAVTAHRGFSSLYPENTFVAFDEAVNAGADVVEFDIRETVDGKLVVMHDTCVDRTTDGTGMVREMTFAEIRTLNATYWNGPHDTGRRLDTPAIQDVGVPSFEETLASLAQRTCLNIQVYADSAAAKTEIVRLYDTYGLYESGFLMVSTFADAEAFRRLNRRVRLCVGENRDAAKRHAAFGLQFLQPWRQLITPEYAAEIAEHGLAASVFYANTPEQMSACLQPGIKGILTDCLEMAIPYLAERDLR